MQALGRGGARCRGRRSCLSSVTDLFSIIRTTTVLMRELGAAAAPPDARTSSTARSMARPLRPSIAAIGASRSAPAPMPVKPRNAQRAPRANYGGMERRAHAVVKGRLGRPPQIRIPPGPWQNPGAAGCKGAASTLC